MNFIEHIIEPTKLLIAWQSSDERYRTRYIVGELHHNNEETTLIYLVDTPDFQKAKEKGFESYPAFPDVNKTYQNVLNAFMRRLPPRTRGDFPEYLATLRLKADATLSDFALLGYSGAKLPSDGFSIIHPFNDASGQCELLLEVAGFRHIQENNNNIKVDSLVSFLQEKVNAATQEKAIKITIDDNLIGYVNRGLIPTFWEWIESKRIIGAWVEKINGSPTRPALYIYVKVAESAEKMR